ncbi:hypothetical protein N8I74_03215 [Chitiniphilus purpureus]|uniref:Uncharacterized protein n=1 Tax=Chitiniphilus purpureus TaxID=2981137 RepID=A0ABY6DRD7_9NEIS|nr:hypothetical protein [Chitiniphilus sp. CD1]UXY16046.1 hypothetical protein N8I74_03215 [Chitiniphilus sp. CD1]
MSASEVRRQRLQTLSTNNPTSSTPGSYAHSISWVNPIMQRMNIPLSGGQYRNMTNSMSEISRGSMLNSQASAREGRHFFRDMFNPNLNMRGRVGAGIGFVANTVFGPAFHYNTDLNNYQMNRGQSREMRMAMHHHVAGDLFT